MSESMGHGELLKDLREKRDAQIQIIWDNAEAKATERKNAIEAELAAREKRYAEQHHQAWEELRTSILMEARKKADKVLILAQQKLADRLYELARQMLKELRNTGYEEIFARLVRELPAEKWDEIRVNPADVKLASVSFPAARIVSDDRITGGFSALTSDGLEVVNTLDKRLDRAWESMVPDLLATFDNQETAP